MPRIVKPLTDTEISRAKPKEKQYPLSDGNGLILRVNPNGSKIWVFNYYHPVTKKRTHAGLGMYPAVTLAQARAKREEYRALLAKGIDPQEHRAKQNKKVIDPTFKEVCKRWFDEIYPRTALNPKTRKENWNRLENKVFPTIGDLPLKDIRLKILVDLYQKIGASPTLDKLHRIIKKTLDYGIKLEIIDSHNCDIAKDDFVSPMAKHHPAVTFDEFPLLLNLMNAAFDNGRIHFNTFFGFNLSILLGLRQCELTRLKWSFINEEKNVIIVPSSILKQTKRLKEQPCDHIIPLSEQARKILCIIGEVNGKNGFLFPSAKRGVLHLDSHTIVSAIGRVLERTELEGKQDAHGLRTIFRSYLTSKGVPAVAAELALSHLSSGKTQTQAAYDRYDYLEERKQALQLIGDFCEKSGMRLSFDLTIK